jgi:hypothetical protein
MKKDGTCPSCGHAPHAASPELVSEYRKAQRQIQCDHEGCSLVNDTLLSLGIVAIGALLVAGFSLAPIPLGNGSQVTLIPWGISVFGFYRLLHNLAEWYWSAR